MIAATSFLRGISLALWILCSLTIWVDPAKACEPLQREGFISGGRLEDGAAKRRLTIVYDPETWQAEQEMNSQTIDLRKVLQVIGKECEERDAAKSPIGDTAFLRHPGLLPTLDATTRAAFIAVETARTTAVAIELLSDLTGPDQQPIVRYRAHLEIALRALRTPDGTSPEVIARHLEAAETQGANLRKLRDGTDATADLDFLKASLCWLNSHDAAACKSMVDAALIKDTYFVAARQLRIALNDTALARGQFAGNCDAILGEVVFDIENVLRGVQSNLNKQEIAAALDAASRDGHIVLRLGAAQAYLSAGLGTKASELLDEAKPGIDDNRYCGPGLKTIHARIETLAQEH